MYCKQLLYGRSLNWILVLFFNCGIYGSFFINVDEHHKAFKDPLHVPVEPITKARFKKIKEALNGLILIQDVSSLAQRKMKV